MGYELDKLKRQYGVGTATIAPYVGETLGAPPAETATPEQKAAFQEQLRKYQIDQRAYKAYTDEYANRLTTTNMYAQPQYDTNQARFRPAGQAAIMGQPDTSTATRAVLNAPTYGAIPANVSAATDQGAMYKQMRDLGYTDADIRAATSKITGTPSDQMMANIYKVAYPEYTQAIEGQYGSQFNRSGYGPGAGQIDYPGFNYYINQLSSGAVTPATLESAIRGGAAAPSTTPTTTPVTTPDIIAQPDYNPYNDWMQDQQARDAASAGGGGGAAKGGYISKYASGGSVRTHYQTGGGAQVGDTLADLDAFYSNPASRSQANRIGRLAPGSLPALRPITRALPEDPNLLKAAVAELSLTNRNVTPAMIEQVAEQYGLDPVKVSETLSATRPSMPGPAQRAEPASRAQTQNQPAAAENEPLADWRRAYENLPVNSTEEWSRAYTQLPSNNPMEDFSKSTNQPENTAQTETSGPQNESATAPSSGGGRSGFEDLVSRYMGAGGEYSRELAEARRKSQAETDAFSNMIKQMSERGESPASRSEMYFRLAAAFGAPTRTGAMGETLSKVGEQLSEYSKTRRADEAERRGLLLKAQEIKMAGAREELATTKALAAQESADRRAMAKELVKEYIASRRPQSDAGKIAEDAGYKRGTPEYNDYVQAYIRNKEESGDFYRRAMLELRMADERRKLEKETELSPNEIKMKADQLGGLSTARMALEDIREALRRNSNSYGLSGTDWLAYRGRVASGSADEKVLNTQMIENLLSRGAIDSLKDKFGAGITNEERRALINLAGADASTIQLRESILRRTERELETSIRNREKMLRDISSGAFRKMTNE